MQHRNRAIHESIIFPILSQAGTVVPTNAGIIPKVQQASHTFMDEDAMGKNLDV
jgi:hypothetical protein